MGNCINLSPQHGVNPTNVLCPVCRDAQSLALLGKLPGDEKAPNQIPDIEPCGGCQQMFEKFKLKGILLIATDTEEGENPWPHYRGHAVFAESNLSQITPPALREQIRTRRVAFTSLELFQELTNASA